MKHLFNYDKTSGKHKILLDEKIRIAVSIILIFIVIISLYNLYSSYQIPAEIERNVTISDYAQGSNFNYAVLLKPNSLYDTSTLFSTNQTYFTKIVDRVDTLFFYELTGDKLSSINGSYEVIANINTELWNKSFIIVPKKEFTGGTRANFTVSLPVNVTYYNEISNSIDKEIGVQSKEQKLKLIYNIIAIPASNNEQIKETIAPIIEIPLGKPYFNMQGDLSGFKTGSIKKTELALQQKVLDRRKFSIITTVIFSILFLLFVTLTKNMPLINGTEDKVTKIRKKYGEWIADASELPPAAQGQICVSLNSMDDVIKVAQERGVSIIHAVENGKHCYYAYDGLMRYEYFV
ncbi:MAG TPA: DUF5305 family protein [Candidatus Methylomirabilis sp.]|nr:DUF5305 family protein [Candidatus Methylomirabilis sp.]